MKLCVFEATTGRGLGLVLGEEIADLRRVAPYLSPNPVDILAGGAAGIGCTSRDAP